MIKVQQKRNFQNSKAFLKRIEQFDKFSSNIVTEIWFSNLFLLWTMDQSTRILRISYHFTSENVHLYISFLLKDGKILAWKFNFICFFSSSTFWLRNFVHFGCFSCRKRRKTLFLQKKTARKERSRHKWSFGGWLKSLSSCRYYLGLSMTTCLNAPRCCVISWLPSDALPSRPM